MRRYRRRLSFYDRDRIDCIGPTIFIDQCLRFRPAPMIASIGGELASNDGPGLIVDQRRMLARVELILVRNLPDINRVREQSEDMPA